MRKIISTALIGTLAAASMFADIALNYRTQMYALDMQQVGTKYAKTYLFTQNQTDYNGITGYGATKDSFKFEYKAPRAGVTLEITPQAESQSIKTLTTYSGYVNFFDQALTFSTGYWGNCLYRANRITTDAGNWGGTEFEKNKIGIVGGTYGASVDSVTSINGTAAKLSTYGDLKLPLADNMTLLVRGAYNTNKAGLSVDSASVTCDSSLAALVALTVNKVVDVEAVGQFPSNGNMAFGLYASPLMVKALTLTAGGAFGINTTTSKYEYSADLRARYAVSKQLSFTTMHNFSAPIGNTLYLWDMFNCKYVLNDTIALQCNVSNIVNDINTFSTGAGDTIRVTPGVIFNAPNASITTGIAVEVQKIGVAHYNPVTYIYVPVVMRIKMSM